jgi:tRNA 2-thiouridine synthesizing protein A
MADLSPDSKQVDACGLLCPLPIVRLGEAARGGHAGMVIELLADDPGIREDLPAWCRGHGHTLLSLEELPGGVLRGRLRLA